MAESVSLTAQCRRGARAPASIDGAEHCERWGGSYLFPLVGTRKTAGALGVCLLFLLYLPIRIREEKEV
jgi:hypothetical protein